MGTHMITVHLILLCQVFSQTEGKKKVKAIVFCSLRLAPCSQLAGG